MENINKDLTPRQIPQPGQVVTPPVVETPVVETTPKVGDVEYTKVPTVAYEKLMARIDRLESAADRKGLARFDDQNRDKIGKEIKLITIDGKIIISWSQMIKNIVEKHPLSGVWGEDQIMEITFEDKTTQQIPYVVWARRHEKIPAIVKSEEKDQKTGVIKFKVETKDGKKIEVLETFIN